MPTDAQKSIIEARGLSKTYRIWKDERARLRAPLWRMASLLTPVGGLRTSLRKREHACWHDFPRSRTSTSKFRAGSASASSGATGRARARCSS